MQAVQLGAQVDEEGENISNVEQVLRQYDITLRDTSGEFRNLGDVLDEIAGKWKTLDSVSKSEIASTIAGVRQRERLLILLENYDKVKQAEIMTTQAAGLAQERYGIYLESVEAKQQKFKATWEELWLTTINSDINKAILDIGNAVLELATNLGGIIPILTTILGLWVAFNSASIVGGIAAIGEKVVTLVASLKGASIAASGLAGALGPIGMIIAGISAAYSAYNLITEAHAKKVEEAASAVDTYIQRVENIPSKLSDAGLAVEEINTLFQKFIDNSLTEEDENRLYEQYAILHALIPEYEGWHYSKKGWYLEEAISIETVNELINAQRTITQEEADAFSVTIAEKIKEYKKFIQTIEEEQSNLRVTSLYTGIIESGKQQGLTANQALLEWLKGLGDIPDSALTEAQVDLRNTLYNYFDLLLTEDVDMGEWLKGILGASEGEIEKAVVDSEQAAKEFAAQVFDTWVGAGAELRQKLTEEFGAETPLIKALNEMLIGSDTAPAANALTTQFEDFEQLVATIASAMDGEIKNSFEAFGKRIVDLNKNFEDGKVSVKAYFDSLSEITANKELIDMFDDSTDAAQRFFMTLFANGVAALDSLNSEFETGDIAITDYIDGLVSAQDMFDNQYESLIENADALGLTDEAVNQLTADYQSNSAMLAATTEELVNMSATADLLRQGYDAVMSGDMFSQFQAGAENAIGYYQALSEAAWNYAQQSGFAFKDSEGNALTSANAIYGYLSGGIGNFSNFASQMTERVKIGVAQQNQAIQNAMSALAKVISTFQVTFKAVQTGFTSINFPLPKWFGTIFKVDTIPISVPNIELQGSSSIGGMEELGNAISTVFNPQPYVPDFGNDIWSGGGGYTPPPVAGGGGGGGGGGQSAEDTARQEAEKAYQDLLKMTIDMLKDRAQRAKEALKEELEAYKKLIKAQKDELNLQKQERRDRKEIEKRTKTVTDLQAELAQLQFDTSQEGIARRLELEEQLAEATEELEDEQFDQRIAAQEAALDRELELYTEYIDGQIAELDRYLQEEGLIVQEAQALIHGRTQEFYDDLMEWNMTYGSGIAQDVIDAWQGAITWIETFSMQGSQAVSNFASSAAGSVGNVNTAIGNAMSNASALATALSNIFGGGVGRGNFIVPFNTQATYHSGGIVGDIPNLDEQEVFAKLLKGEVVATKEQTYNFMKSTLPNMIEAGRQSSGDINVEINIPVSGNLDKTVVPDIERAVSKAIMSIRTKAGLQSSNNFNSI